jgi:hypothetical protein
VVAIFSGAIDPGLAFGIPGHVLLLPEGLLLRFFLDPPACAVSEHGITGVRLSPGHLLDVLSIEQ